MTQPGQPTDHYFDARMTDPQGRPIPSPGRFRTLQGALLFTEQLGDDIDGTIYYLELPESVPRPMIRYIDGRPEAVS